MTHGNVRRSGVGGVPQDGDGLGHECETDAALNRNDNDLGEVTSDALPVRVDVAGHLTGIDVEFSATPET